MLLVGENLYGPAHCLVPRQCTDLFPNTIVFAHKAAHWLVTRQHIVSFQDSTTAHGWVPRQHIVWFQDSTLFGPKQAHCLVPTHHVVWLQDTKTYIFHKILHERVRHGSPRAHIKSGRSYAFHDDFYMGLGHILHNIMCIFNKNRASGVKKYRV